MDRLTDEYNARDLRLCADGHENVIASLHGWEIERIYVRLSAYEDSGLAPEEVSALKAALKEGQNG